MQTTSRKQLGELVSRFATETNWGQLGHDLLQSSVVELPSGEFGRRMTVFLRNGCRFEIKAPSALTIDRSKPFDPVKFIGEGWGIVEEDERALLLDVVDFSKVVFESGLHDGESGITSDVKFARLQQGGKIRLDAKIAQALFEEKGKTTLRFLYDTCGVDWMEFVGTVLRHDGDNLSCLGLCRSSDGSWDWNYFWLSDERGAADVSPLFAR